MLRRKKYHWLSNCTIQEFHKTWGGSVGFYFDPEPASTPKHTAAALKDMGLGSAWGLKGKSDSSGRRWSGHSVI